MSNALEVSDAERRIAQERAAWQEPPRANALLAATGLAATGLAAGAAALALRRFAGGTNG